ncbi:5-formyltetrahydrofolate cyclo-ligase [Lederbergia citrea]|uniref:5-formyltetrahydrofolate cyclo-ligase n=1 Tax=Lederbergia citrea TaxID=2833581 RepID=A0A942Z4H1_9BACI|nr:5-formyltetrahydrofolate cyclo-ligase [Lederbergia citrea]MBS4222432.1 5-formyltetrahydrofolate cyclo-ligase [Lederbergia citrea]
MNKHSLRTEVKERLKSMDRMTYEHGSYLIANKLIHTEEWKNADVIGITVSHFPEVDTWQLIRKGWEQGKNMVIPKCIPAKKEMNFKRITAFNQLESVFYGLFEPMDSETKRIDKNDIDLLIVPGLAYSKEGFRIGFGGGYYDRFLKGYHGATLSLAFAVQLLDYIPVESHDLPVSKIITEKSVINCQ